MNLRIMSMDSRRSQKHHKAHAPYMPSPEEYVTALAEPPHGGGGDYGVSRHGRRWAKGLVAWCFIAMLVGGIGYGSYLAMQLAKISSNPITLDGLAADAAGRTNILVLGVGDPGHAGEKLTDTVMIVSLDQTSKRVAQISIPRDLRVQIPGYGYQKINTANVYGGIPLVERVVSDTFDIPIHYYVETDFAGLSRLVDAAGGIDVNVTSRLYDPEYPCSDNQYKSCGLDIKPGLTHMDGVTALQYARCRKGTCGNDFGRAARQQEVMNLLREKIVRWDVLLNPIKLIPVVTAVQDGVKTDMSALQLAQFGRIWQEAKDNQPVSVVLSTSEGGYLRSAPGSSDLVPVGGSFASIREKINSIFTLPGQETK